LEIEKLSLTEYEFEEFTFIDNESWSDCFMKAVSDQILEALTTWDSVTCSVSEFTSVSLNLSVFESPCVSLRHGVWAISELSTKCLLMEIFSVTPKVLLLVSEYSFVSLNNEVSDKDSVFIRNNESVKFFVCANDCDLPKAVDSESPELTDKPQDCEKLFVPVNFSVTASVPDPVHGFERGNFSDSLRLTDLENT
jgi:hypothetical protein